MDKILVIDDEERILKHFKTLLMMMNYEPLTANNSADGCRLAQDPDVKMIITDLAMPGELNQIGLVRELRRLRPNLPLVVISGFPTPEVLNECENLGVRDFLTKPFELSFINSVIKRLLGSPSGETK